MLFSQTHAVTNCEMYLDSGILKFLAWEGMLAPCKD